MARSADFLTWFFVTDDEEVAACVESEGFQPLRDRGSDLNEVLAAALADIAAVGAESVTVLPSDVPLAYSGDLQDILDTGAISEMVVVPAHDGGTNALYLSPPTLITPAFGPASLTRHLKIAEERGLRCSMLPLDRLSLDIDDAEDVSAYLTRKKFAPSKTQALLKELAAAGTF